MATRTPTDPNASVAPVVPTQAFDPNDPPAGNRGTTGQGDGPVVPPTPPLSPVEDLLTGPEAPYTPPSEFSQADEDASRRQFDNDRLDAQREALIDLDALTAEYERTLGSLRGQYQTAQTPQEKERLRFILADIEAQYEAGAEAITSLYAETDARLSERATNFRGQIETRAQDVESGFHQLAQSSIDRNLGRVSSMVDQNRGLGFGVGYTGEDANTRFMSSLAPIQGNYSRMMGESTADMIDFVRDISQQQGIAQRGDLRRLAATTRTTAIMAHEQQVEARIQAERAAQRSDSNALRMAALAARQSATELNAKLLNNAINAQEYMPGPDAQETYIGMTGLATRTGEGKVPIEQFLGSFRSQFGGNPPREFIDMYIVAFNSAALSEINALADNNNRLGTSAEAQIAAERNKARIRQLEEQMARNDQYLQPSRAEQE